MSCFRPNRLDCFICASLIGERGEAARLFFAHPDDVGETARHGRAWVHRRCWSDWPLREAWARSAARLLTNQEDVQTVSDELVVCRIGERDILLQDTWQSIEVSIPRDRVDELLASIGATSSSSTVTLRGLRWTFTAGEHGLEVTVEDETERFETFSLEPHRWRRPLERARLL